MKAVRRLRGIGIVLLVLALMYLASAYVGLFWVWKSRDVVIALSPGAVDVQFLGPTLRELDMWGDSAVTPGWHVQSHRRRFEPSVWMRMLPPALSRIACWPAVRKSSASALFGTVVIVPLWCLSLPAIGFVLAASWLRHRRPQGGRCRVCGYDLTGNVSGRCPECGTVVPSMPGAMVKDRCGWHGGFQR